MPSNVDPLPMVFRYEPGQSYSQDILGEIEGFDCAQHSQTTAGENYNGREWYELDYSPNVFKTPEQVNALTCGQVLNFPAAHPERIEYFDLVHRVNVAATGATGDGFSLFFELVRVPVIRWGIAVIERLATFVRAQALNDQGAPAGPPVILGGNLGNTVSSVLAAPPTNMTDPCPFPFASAFIDGRALSLTFRAIFQGNSRLDGSYDPAFMVAGPNFPTGFPVLPEWSDMRYAWGSRYTENLKLITGEHGWVRVLVRIDVAGGGAVGSGWDLEFCSRLAGYRQNAGPAGAAQRSALWRI